MYFSLITNYHNQINHTQVGVGVGGVRRDRGCFDEAAMLAISEDKHKFIGNSKRTISRLNLNFIENNIYKLLF
jgi:hypothetical protein